MCFYWRRIQAPSPEPELTTEEVRAISDRLGPLFQIVVSGGEPFLRGDLVEIAQYWHRTNGIAVLSIPTNALLPDRIVPTVDQICSRLGNVAVRINVSLDGIGQLHDEIRGVPGAYERAIETFHGLKDLKKRHPNLAVNIGSVLSYYNRDQITDIADHVMEHLQPDLYGVGWLRGEPADPKAREITIDDYARASAHLSELENRYKASPYPFRTFGPTFHSLMRDSIEDIVKSRRMPMPCVAGSKLMVIDEVGHVYPCEMLQHLIDAGEVREPPCSEASMGSLREFDYDMGRLLDSDKARRVSSFIKQHGCWCTYECAVFASMLMVPRYYPRLLARLIRKQLRSLWGDTPSY
jgi:MoaA/NifB/PqqE/SkfB family radical SAM enzyme